MRHCEPARDQCKSPEHALAGRLAVEVGLSPVQIRAALDLVAKHLEVFYGQLRPPGVITHTAVSAKEPAGKPIKNCQVVPVPLTVVHPADLDVLRQHGTVELRMTRLYRWTVEARAAGGLLSYEDLHVLLGVDTSTVRDLVHRLRERGLLVPTRGFIKDIGPEPSHKELIADLLGRGFSTSQIVAKTKHSEGAIGRYQHQFGLVLYLLHHHPDASDDDRCRLSGLTETAYRAYLAVARALLERPECRPHLERLRRRYELDPEGIGHPPPAAAKAHQDLAGDRLEQQTLETALRQMIQRSLGTTSRIAEIVAADLHALVDAAHQLPDALRAGEAVVFVDAYEAAGLSGERATDRRVIPVRVPLLTPDALATWRADEPPGRRRARLACQIATATLEQGGIMTLAKLAEILHIEPGTLAKNLRELAVELHVEAPTKGLLEDAGPTLTHKNWIVDLDQHGLTGEEIAWLTRHAPISRDRYIETYRRAETLMRLTGRIPEPEELARLFSIRRHVAQQYVDLLRRYHPDRNPTPASTATRSPADAATAEARA